MFLKGDRQRLRSCILCGTLGHGLKQLDRKPQADEGFRAYVRAKRYRRSPHCATLDFLLTLWRR